MYLNLPLNNLIHCKKLPKLAIKFKLPKTAEVNYIIFKSIYIKIYKYNLLVNINYFNVLLNILLS